VIAIIVFFVLLAGLLAMLGLSGRWLQAHQARRALPPEVQVLVSVAATEAARRRHALVGVEHLACALLCVPDVVRAMKVRGIDVGALRSALDSRLAELDPPDGVDPSPEAKLSEEIQWVIRAAIRQSARPWGVSAVMTSFVRVLATETAMRELLTSHGVDGHWLAAPEDVATAATSGSPPRVLPYRAPERAVRARVVFWNDGKSTMEGVVGVLKEVFAMSDAEALYVMLLVHKVGQATARTCDAQEAAALAERATAVAGARGMRTRITVEPLSAAARPRRFRWFGRRGFV
jgi:ATP-dependent Clp protease adapter protein ClpS